MPVTQSDVEIAIGELRVEKTVERKAILASPTVQRIIEEQDLLVLRQTKQAQNLPTQSAIADYGCSLHLVATKPRYLNKFRDTGNAR